MLAANSYTLTLTGAPVGMSVSASGTVSWPKPVAGLYVVTVSATDANRMMSQLTIPIVITP